jgi:preprotein translocase subunit SecE
LARGEKMAESGKAKKPGKEPKQKKHWFKGLKSEFNKIIWTDRVTLGKQTVAVVSITVVLGVVITILDSLVLQFMNLIIR